MDTTRILIKDPDKLKCVKVGINKILKKENYNSTIVKLTDAANRMNKLVIQTYQFIRLYILYKYSKRETLPNITPDFINMVFLVLTDDTKKYKKMVNNDPTGVIPIEIRYKRVHTNSIPILKSLVDFYEKYALKIGITSKIDGKHLSQILGYTTKSIITSIENHIRENYINHVKFYVNQIYLSTIPKDDKDLYYSTKNELYIVKNDIIDGTLKSDPKYHDFIKGFRGKYIPEDIKYKALMKNITKNPQSFLIYMIRMSSDLENKKLKQQQFIPLRSSCIIKYIPIDTKIIVELLCDSNKKEYLDNLNTYKDHIWSMFFNINKRIFKKKNHYFRHLIYTDCVGVSILFEHNSYKEKTDRQNEKKRLGRIKQKQAEKGMTKEERIEAKLKRNQKKEKERNLKRKIREEKKAAYNALSNKEKKKLREKNKFEKDLANVLKEIAFDKLSKKERKKALYKEELTKRKKQPEFPYLTELTNSQLKELQKRNLVYVDPGKIRLYTMVGKDISYGPILCNHKVKKNVICKRCDKQISSRLKFLKYSNKQRLFETKRLKYQSKLREKKIELNIDQLEKQLSLFKSKTCKFDLFIEYLNKKNNLNDELFEKYNHKIFRKYKWRAYSNRQQSEQKLVDKIKALYGDNCVLIMGDWSISKQMRGIISTPMIGLKRRLSRHFDIINLDEFRTSIINNVTKEKCVNLVAKLFDKRTHKRISKPVHSVLTYKMTRETFFV